MQRYTLGAEVKVEFMGKITEAYFRDGITYYTVKGDIISSIYTSENYITPLELPKENA